MSVFGFGKFRTAMKRNLVIVIIIFLSTLEGGVGGGLLHAQMKTWWFFGYERTTNEGMKADLKALKDAGFDGVVWYDQNHRNKDCNLPEPEQAFSPEWWQHLRFAAEETKRMGMSFEINLSNGYVAGGRWIDPQHAMQRVASAECVVSTPMRESSSFDYFDKLRNQLRELKGGKVVSEIALLAVPCKDDDSIRYISAHYEAHGKGRNGAMQCPSDYGKREFAGAGFKKRENIGVLQYSNDSLEWYDITHLAPMYSSQGVYAYRTTTFPAVKGKYYRVKYYGKEKLKSWSLGSSPKIDRWEEKAGLQSDFASLTLTHSSREGVQRGSPMGGYSEGAPSFSPEEVVDLGSIDSLESKINSLPEGKWRIIRLASVLTGAKSKHGRENLLGYECDKLSEEAALLHWNSYTQVIIDSLQNHQNPQNLVPEHVEGHNLISGVTMDSHEGGSQNWTPLMLDMFRRYRGYDLKAWLPVLAGYVMESEEKTEQVLRDVRLTINDCLRNNYYGTFQRMAEQNGLSFTAQAIGNALCIIGDAVSVKQAVEKPQGEFWTYQQDGAYDIKDCSSAAHLYGKKIASAEAMTDALYSTTPHELARVTNIAFSLGAQELVICATPHIPDVDPAEPYIAGREYAINRSNPRWGEMKKLWKSFSKSMKVLQQGKAAPDVLIFLGDDVPVKTLAHRLPEGLNDLDWDVCTGDALVNRIHPTNSGTLTTPDGITYKALIIEDGVYISPASQKKIHELRSAGVPILKSAESIVPPLQIISTSLSSQNHSEPSEPFITIHNTVAHTHRIINGQDVFFLANILDQPQTVAYRFANESKTRTILLKADEAVFLKSLPPTPSHKEETKASFHFSFDDVILCLQDITEHQDTYNSMFENPFLGFLKEMHEQYGATFSLYCFTQKDDWRMEMVTDRFKREFKANADWLKLGLHLNLNGGYKNYSETTAEQAKRDYDYCIKQIMRITGSKHCIDRNPRLHNFAGNTESLLAMKNCRYGIRGAMGADDRRNSYNLDSIQSKQLRTIGRFVDPTTGLQYISTQRRLEKADPTTFLNTEKPILELFTHEGQFYKSPAIKKRIITALKWAKENNYSFVFY